jgi:hypothetical protein
MGAMAMPISRLIAIADFTREQQPILETGL